MDENIVFRLEGITKKYGSNTVLDNVSFDIKRGEVLALLGENGAGKSTILNIMSGSLKADSGQLYKEEQHIQLNSPLAAKKAGIVKVHQELQLVPELSAAENIYLGNEIKHPVTGAVWYKKMYEQANSVLQRLKADFDASRQVKTLSTAQKQLVEISKAIMYDISVLILDEPTSSLTNKEIENLFAIVRQLRDEGKAIVFVSHRMPEVFEISDRITVLKNGIHIGTLDTKEATPARLIKMMTGRDLGGMIKNPCTTKTEEVVLAVKNLSGIRNRFKDVSFDLHRGEIIGFAGLVGSGRTEVMRALVGADPKTGGKVYLHGKEIHIKNPKDSVRNRIAFIPEDRRLQGMVGILSNKWNIGLGSFGKLKKGILREEEIATNADHFMKMLSVRPMDVEMPTKNLSGGNQQKVVIGKWLSTEADIFIMDEPTRGIDVGAKDEIYRLMLDLVKEGKSIIMVSSELPEVLNLSDRIFIMHEGTLCHETAADGQTEESILHYAMRGKLDE